MDLGLIATAITAILGIIGAVSTAVLVYVRRVFNAIKESGDVLALLGKISLLADQAMSDNQLTKEEISAVVDNIKRIKPEVDEAISSWKAITDPVKRK